MKKTIGAQRLWVGAAVMCGVAACASPADPHAAGMSMPSTAPERPSASAPAPPVTADMVSIKDFAYAPAEITVRMGTTVTWENADQDPHTVTSAGGSGPLRSPVLNKGDRFKFTFGTAGRYEYLCTIHPFMTAVVTVTP